MRLSIFNLAPGAASDVATDIDNKDFVGHINLALVHIVKHFLGAVGPDFIVSGMAEESDADDDIAFKSQALLGFKKLVLEAGATTILPVFKQVPSFS